MSDTPLVSIILSCYNRADLLGATLDSLRHQTYRDFELICVDDGSTDNVPEILAAYAKKDPRIKVICKPHTNVGDTRNVGYQHSHGAYLFFLDADDIYAPEFIAQMVQTMQTEQSDLVACKYAELDHQTGDIIRERNFKNYPVTQRVTTLSREQYLENIFQLVYDVCWNKIFRRQIIDRYYLQFAPLAASDDITLVFPYLVKCQKITLLDECLLQHRTNDPRSVTKNIGHQIIRCQAMDYWRRQLTKQEFRAVKSSYYFKYLAISLSCLKNSDYQDGQIIFNHTRKVLRHVKVRTASITDAAYRSCLKYNQFALFYDFLQERKQPRQQIVVVPD